MKRVVFPALVVLVLLWNCRTVFSQEKGRRKGPSTEERQKKKRGEAGKAFRPVDPNKVPREIKAARLREMERERLRMRELQKKRRKELLKMSEKKRKEREEARIGRDAGQPEAGVGKEHEQQLNALRTQLAKEDAKHLKRTARLKRIQELAAEEDSKQILTRVEKLRRKEQQRYARKRDRMQMRMRMLMRIQQRERNVRPPAEKRLSEESRKAMMERRANAEKDKGKTKSKKKPEQ